MKTFIKRKMKRIYLVALAATLTLSSCNTVFYQVYNTEAPGMIEKDNSLVYENEDCKLMYNLWAEDGSLGFIMHNKTDRDLFVVLPQTFFIKNGIAFIKLESIVIQKAVWFPQMYRLELQLVKLIYGECGI